MRPGLTASRIIGASLAFAVSPVHALSPRTEIADAYDFIVVGGGQAGLVLGARLSEDTNHTVLVLESGGNGDDYRERIDTPAYGYFDSLWTTPLNWGFYTVAQPCADNREIYWPRGKVLGGSSAINGLYMTRPGEIEINAWKDMLEGMDGAENWTWESFYAAMKKSETFTPPSDAIADEADITWNVSTHGSEGPIHASYPGYTFPQVGQWSQALENMGIAISSEMYGGENWGAEVSTSSINPSNWTRSYSRTGYLDPLPDWTNYDVLANAHVTRLVFDNSSTSGNLTATAVEYTPDDGTTKVQVKIRKEVILAAGTVGSPAVLLHSGIGPKDVLSDAGVDLVSELPGVGQHLQDHFSATVKWTTDVETAGSIYYDNGSDKDDTLFLSYIDSAVAYVNSTAIYNSSSSVQEFQTSILAMMDQYTPNTTYDEGVIAGYKAIYNTTASKIFDSPIGQIELLFMNSDGNGDIGITAALQHPYSQGRIYINSSDPMDYPVIDPNYLNNPSDYEILREGLKLARRLGETSPMSSNLTGETSPGSSVQTDEEWLDWLLAEASTEFHPSSSCAMLPRDQGGVVDANLRVYGLSNVRVADASVIPIALSTHLMASTYGIAEKASDIIRAYYEAASTTTPSFSTTTPLSRNGATSTVTSQSNGSTREHSIASWYSWVPVMILSAQVLVIFDVLF
ncbi:Glucose-methanol-choline oxidoreductase [Penicillium macrosclerotiorum]|uniref:Glucose-methanol-choline oxidoreductase n=1 Tax=Penicillium macrosclerotiorum TaxID=303699 RepID=UPI002548E680|nr:Glucose-methanol-choline oxidoreductase [Penicillium macrosclerotiorum]KAJ5669001.1 Glucose-methanol-choline oxidoreductase [Penicillium macrosclerotiorum]